MSYIEGKKSFEDVLARSNNVLDISKHTQFTVFIRITCVRKSRFVCAILLLS